MASHVFCSYKNPILSKRFKITWQVSIHAEILSPDLHLQATVQCIVPTCSYYMDICYLRTPTWLLQLIENQSYMDSWPASLQLIEFHSNNPATATRLTKHEHLVLYLCINFVCVTWHVKRGRMHFYKFTSKHESIHDPPVQTNCKTQFQLAITFLWASNL